MDEYQSLFDSKNVSSEDKNKLSYIFKILSHLPNTSSAAITPSSELIHQLFTHLGSQHGTLLRLGLKMTSHNNLDFINVSRLINLLESSFGKQLSSNYFTRLQTLPFQIYLAGDYKG